MADVLLIQPPLHDFYLTAKRTMPYGLASLASALEAEEFEVEILDGLATRRRKAAPLPEEMSYLGEFYGEADRSPFGLFNRYWRYGHTLEHLGRQARRSGAFLVGVSSSFTPYADDALAVAQAVKDHHPHCRVVLGGHHPTALPRQALANPAVDFVLRGEAERSLPALARALQRGEVSEQPVRDLPGLCWRGRSGELCIREPATVEDLDGCPLPATRLLDRAFYSRGGATMAVVVTSRGCPQRCTYCSVGAASHAPYRRRALGAVCQEITEEVLDHGARFIDFEDENLSLDREWFLALLGCVRDLQTRVGGRRLELRAMNGLMPHTLDVPLVRAMGEAGFQELNLSLGSSDPEQLRRFRRPDERRALDRVLAAAREQEIRAVCYIIVAAPSQRPETSVQDLLYLARRRVLAGLSIYYPSPGSEDYNTCIERGLMPGSLSLLRSTALPIGHHTSRLQSVTLLRLGRILNFIKGLLDRGEDLPAAEAIPQSQSTSAGLSPDGDRQDLGRRLLAWFFHDGVIRGLTPDGRLFNHHIDKKLTRLFIEGLDRAAVVGTR